LRNNNSENARVRVSFGEECELGRINEVILKMARRKEAMDSMSDE
jgi:hypothetical protein